MLNLGLIWSMALYARRSTHSWIDLSFFVVGFGVAKKMKWILILFQFLSCSSYAFSNSFRAPHMPFFLTLQNIVSYISAKNGIAVLDFPACVIGDPPGNWIEWMNEWLSEWLNVHMVIIKDFLPKDFSQGKGSPPGTMELIGFSYSNWACKLKS